MLKHLDNILQLLYIYLTIKTNDMKTYKNVTGLNKIDMDSTSLLKAVKEQLQNSYPSLRGENLTIVADLMVRHDEDVTEENGQFTCYSAE